MMLNNAKLATLLLCSFLLSACGGSNNSSSTGNGPEIPPSVRNADILVFYAICCEGQAASDRKAQLYKFNVKGETIQLSDPNQTESVDSTEVSPDKERVAYSYYLDNDKLGLKILKIDSTEQEFSAPPFAGDRVQEITWRPDSQSLIYLPYIFDNRSGSLSLASISEDSPSELIRNISDYTLSGDGTLIATLTTSYEAGQPVSAELNLLDLTGQLERTLLETTTGSANQYNLGWSPYANDLLYQARSIDSDAYFTPADEPAGPLMLRDADGHILPILDANPNYPSEVLPFLGMATRQYRWIDEQRILLNSSGAPSFLVVARDGSIIVEQEISYGSLIAASPDQRHLAFINYDQGDRDKPQVYIMNIDTGDVQAVGRGSVLWLDNSVFDSSILRWSEDGSMLAWNSGISYDKRSRGELYVHNLETSITQLITSDFVHVESQIEPYYQSVFRDQEGNFSWLPGENLLEYVTDSGAGLKLALTDPIANKTQVVGQMAASVDTPCQYARIWRTKEEVVWNHCGDSVYHSLINTQGEVTNTKILDGDMFSTQLTDNREYVAIRSGLAGAIGHWYMFDFVADKLLKVEIPEGAAQPFRIELLQ